MLGLNFDLKSPFFHHPCYLPTLALGMLVCMINILSSPVTTNSLSCSQTVGTNFHQNSAGTSDISRYFMLQPQEPVAHGTMWIRLLLIILVLMPRLWDQQLIPHAHHLPGQRLPQAAAR